MDSILEGKVPSYGKRYVSVVKGRPIMSSGEPVGKRMQRLRESVGASIEELASRAGLTASAIRMIESGQTKTPNFAAGVKIANALGVSPEELLGLKPRVQAGQRLLDQARTDADTAYMEQLATELRGLFGALEIRVDKLEKDFDRITRFETLRREAVEAFSRMSAEYIEARDQARKHRQSLQETQDRNVERLDDLEGRLARLEGPRSRQ